MLGTTVGTLNVMVSSPNNKKSATLWTLIGQQGNSWLQATVPISKQDWTQDYQVLVMEFSRKWIYFYI